MLPKKSSLISNNSKYKHRFCLALVVLIFNLSKSQIGNYVSNGSFEERIDCIGINEISKAKFWCDLDSVNYVIPYCSVCFGKVPLNGWGYQYPRTGEAYVLGTLYCQNCSGRAYLRNRLKRKLEANKTYCVKFYVNINNNSNVGFDSFGAYFADSSIDTITQAHKILNYLLPQVQNPINNIIKDTLGWAAITGTFTATGNEKYVVIGNFKINSAINSSSILPNYTMNPGADVNIDDVSCIPLDLPAFAGEDKHIIPGETLYIGRQRDVGIDEACMWYKLPVTITPTTPALDTAAGIFVSPVVTTTYVVKQDICGVIKYDTVVVFKDGVGIDGIQIVDYQLQIWPNPAKDILTIKIENESLLDKVNHIELYNNLGQLVREEEVSFKMKETTLDVSDLPEGIYTFKLVGLKPQRIYKRFSIAR